MFTEQLQTIIAVFDFFIVNAKSDHVRLTLLRHHVPHHHNLFKLYLHIREAVNTTDNLSTWTGKLPMDVIHAEARRTLIDAQSMIRTDITRAISLICYQFIPIMHVFDDIIFPRDDYETARLDSPPPIQIPHHWPQTHSPNWDHSPTPSDNGSWGNVPTPWDEPAIRPRTSRVTTTTKNR